MSVLATSFWDHLEIHFDTSCQFPLAIQAVHYVVLCVTHKNVRKLSQRDIARGHQSAGWQAFIKVNRAFAGACMVFYFRQLAR